MGLDGKRVINNFVINKYIKECKLAETAFVVCHLGG